LTRKNLLNPFREWIILRNKGKLKQREAKFNDSREYLIKGAISDAKELRDAEE